VRSCNLVTYGTCGNCPLSTMMTSEKVLDGILKNFNRIHKNLVEFIRDCYILIFSPFFGVVVEA
jgi:hypothetical protein